MKNDTAKKRYCPHLLETKLHAVKIYRKTKDLSFVCRRYHISKASLMRRNRAYDGTKNSLQNQSHKPHSSHRTSRRKTSFWQRRFCEKLLTVPPFVTFTHNSFCKNHPAKAGWGKIIRLRLLRFLFF